MTYEQAKKDYKFLYSIAEVEDLIGIESEMWTLMENPTKETAKRLYQNAIELWFREHGMNDSRALAIAERHSIGE